MKIKIKRLTPTATLPTYGSEKAACMDLYADCPNEVCDMEAYSGYTTMQGLKINSHSTVKVHTGLAIQPPEGYFGEIFARSGLATKCGLRPANCEGICDEDYRGEYIVALHNDTEFPQIIHHGDRIAQLMFRPYEQADIEEVTELDTTARGVGGFGSTGTN